MKKSIIYILFALFSFSAAVSLTASFTGSKNPKA